MTGPGEEDSIAVLLLRGRLEGFELEAHARSLLEIPRVVALEARRQRPPRLLATAAPLRQARRLRFPGRVRLLLLYHPAQYPLARALRDRHDGADLWYVAPDRLDGGPPDELEQWREYDGLARERATATLALADPAAEGGSPTISDATLRERLRELDVISPYAFMPAGRRWRPGR